MFLESTWIVSIVIERAFFQLFFFSFLFFFLSVHWSCSIIFFLFQNKSIGGKKWRITLPVSFSHFYMNIFANGQSYLFLWYTFEHIGGIRWNFWKESYSKLCNDSNINAFVPQNVMNQRLTRPNASWYKSWEKWSEERPLYR